MEYEPRSVRELLVEMKDCAGLMIDLAYSSVLFNDQKLANEVLKLEERMDRLRDLLRMHLMIAVRDAEDAEAGISIANVAIATDKISDAAADIAYLTLKGVVPHKVIREALELGEEKVGKIELRERSNLTNRTLGYVSSKAGVDVIAVQRAGKWMINPPEDFALQPNQSLLVRGSKSAIDRLKRMAKRRLKRVA